HSVRLSWAKLLKRVFEIDMEHCPNCGGELKIIAAAYFSTSRTAFQADRGRSFSVIADGISV
ncbi:MAG: hypothetical protein ABIP61_06140, partial [Burkholderiaceae bacterium]